MLELLIVMALIALNGFFALSEMALVTARTSRLRQLSETSRGARAALKLAEHPDNLLSTVQIGITLIGVLTGVFGGEAIGQMIASWLADVFPTAIEYARPIGIGTAVGLITAGSVIFGELIPKRLALTNPEGISAAVAIPLQALATGAKPVVATLGAINRLVLRLLGIRDDNRNAVSEEEIRMLVSEGHEQGVIDADERNMMNRVLRLGDRFAESLMTPRTRIAWLDAAKSFEDNLAIMRATPFSRYPVYRRDDSDVVGVLEVKSLIDRIDTGEFDLFKDMREPLFVSESTPALKLVEILREGQQSLALVVDEYGDVTGIISVNDVLEAVIGRTSSGEGADSHPLVVQRDDGSWLVDGALGADSLRELLGGGPLPNEDEHDYNTAAGMTIAHFGRIPNAGEHFEWGVWRLEVVDLDGPRVDKLLLQRTDATAPVGDG
ncbi:MULTISPECIES: hemolysin family protein [unclassified Luteimonas]|uniref:hemolysin family protein n=1 Tax=unclassified Luteimonas TaxID=2629088 RepID=UPI001601D9BE|nr:hemolysin family protein [Luteimonas sp. MC1825]MBB1472152.1 HlyC/CorC family transporter [Luteimonas sp. MC1782]MBB6599121.1 HlyC/CorC family transporter [Luteimonas sp. MC1825]QOC89246.1 HlyC/CorC family transporter [Luteimonas sp. MC1825]